MVKPLTEFVEEPLPLGSLLHVAAQTLSSELDGRLAAAGFDGLRGRQAPIVMAIEDRGTRSTVIAQRAGITKQAAGEQIRALCSQGYLQMVADPSDGRAQLVQRTPRGDEALRLGRRVVAEFDAWLDGAVGAQRVADLRATLSLVIAAH